MRVVSYVLLAVVVVLVLARAAFALLALQPGSLPRVYAREVERRRATVAPAAALVSARDLEPLPPPVQRFLRQAGVVGRPRVMGFRARFHGRLRNGLDAPWMRFTSEQHNFTSPSARLFLMDASLYGVPLHALHRFAEDGARFQVRAASLVDLVDGRGEQMDQGETVTILNDLCVMAPAALLDPAIRWTAIDERSARVTYTRAGRTVSAVLSFDARGDLVDFVSEDRFMSADGKTFERYPWRTPLRDHRDFGGVRLPANAETVWKTPKGDFVYGEFGLDEIEYF
jgi:hypothetical protein